MATPATRHSLGDQFESILTAAQDGGEWAVATLYRWLHPALISYLRGRAGDEAEDLASDTWLAVARALSSFTATKPPSGRGCSPSPTAASSTTTGQWPGAPAPAASARSKVMSRTAPSSCRAGTIPPATS